MPNVLELFGGCGGLGYGFHQEKFNIICANELDKNIASTYQKNFPDTEVVVGDITLKTIKDKIYQQFSDISCDVIVGGPPCVAYSMSGQRNSRDPRGQLFKDYLAIVKHLKPKMFVMENVKGILTMKHDKEILSSDEKLLAEEYYEVEKRKIELAKETKQFSNQKRNFKKGVQNGYSEVEHKVHQKEVEKNRKDLKKLDKNVEKFRITVPEKIVESFREIGYQVKFKMLNSADYGVPQRRERVIFIGVDTQIDLPIIYPSPTHHKEGTEGLKKWISVREAIDDLKDAPHNEEFSHIYTQHSPEQVIKIKNTPIGKSVNPKYTEACFRCYPDLPSGTVKENHGGVFVHYEKNRVMTPRELARLQSFPDDFIFQGKKNSILVQLGNAVPCGLAQSIAKAVNQSFNSKQKLDVD